MPHPPITPEQTRLAEALVREAQAHDGLIPLDLERFWHEQDLSARDPFGNAIPQLPLNIFNSSEPVFDELGVAEDFWRYDRDDAWRLELHRAYNDRAEKIIGRRILSEQPRPRPEDTYPQVKQLHDIFEARNEWHGWSWWLQQAAHDPDELRALLDRVEARLDDLRTFILPPRWDEAKARLTTRGIKPPRYTHQRGPCTFATSIYGPENLLLLILDEPDLAARLRDTILRGMCGLRDVLDAECGYTRGDAPRGFSFADDNCALFTPEMYAFFGLPIVQGMFERYAPDAPDWRYQHSDSAMGHLLPLLGPLNYKAVNFGPTLAVAEIRRHMPQAVIQGQLAPLTFSRHEEVHMLSELFRDFAQARATRGLLFSTAGSINNGSRLIGMRLLMAAAQRHCRFEG